MHSTVNNSHTCPCCGYANLKYSAYEKLQSILSVQGVKPPYAQYFGAPSYEVCPCCGFEFGNDDEPGTADPVSFGEYLSDWIRRGAEWFDPSACPSGWNLEKQLMEAGIMDVMQ